MHDVAVCTHTFPVSSTTCVRQNKSDPDPNCNLNQSTPQAPFLEFIQRVCSEEIMPNGKPKPITPGYVWLYMFTPGYVWARSNTN